MGSVLVFKTREIKSVMKEVNLVKKLLATIHYTGRDMVEKSNCFGESLLNSEGRFTTNSLTEFWAKMTYQTIKKLQLQPSDSKVLLQYARDLPVHPGKTVRLRWQRWIMYK